MLHSPRTLPGSLITSTLNLPIGQGEQTVAAHFVNPPPFIDLKKPSSRPPSHDRSRDRTNNRSRGSSKDKKYPPRQPSKSPRRDDKKERGRSP